jgi:hypothetical protein
MSGLLAAVTVGALLGVSPAAARATITITGHSAGLATEARAATNDTDEIDNIDRPGVNQGPGAFGFSIGGHPAPANAHSNSGDASASTSTTVTASGSVDAATKQLTINQSMTSSGSVSASRPDENVDGDPNGVSEEEGGTGARFTIDHPESFRLTASLQTPGPNFPLEGDPGVTLERESPNPATIARITSDQPAGASGTLPAGTYFVETSLFMRIATVFEAESPLSSRESGTVSAGSTLSVGTAPCVPGTTGQKLQVGLAVAQGCFTERKDSSGNPTGVFETDQEAWVGGFDLVPKSGGKLLVAPNDHAQPLAADGNGVDLDFGRFSIPAPLDEIKPFTASTILGLNTAGTIGRFAALPLLEGATAQVTSTWTGGGTGSTLLGEISLQDLSKAAGDVVSLSGNTDVGTLAGKLTLTQTNGKPLDVTAGSLDIPSYAVLVKDSNPPLKMGFGGAKFSAQVVNGHTQWSAETSLLFPWEGESGTNQGKISGQLLFSDGLLAGAGVGVSGFTEPLGETGWDLTGVNGQVVLSPSFGLDLGAQAQEHQTFAGIPVLKIDGHLKELALAKPDCATGGDPFELTGKLNSPVIEEKKIGQLDTTVTMCAYTASAATFSFEASVSGKLDVDAFGKKKLFTATGSAKGFFHRTDFNLDGGYSITLPVFGKIGATGLLSSEGYAFCGSYHGISAGFAAHSWLDAPDDIVSCDFTPYRARVPVASAAAATGGEAVRVGRGERVFAIAVRGPKHHAPRVRVSGPHHARFTAPIGDRALTKRKAAVVPVDQLGSTYVYLKRPRAGVWRVTRLHGSAPIRKIQTAHELPPARPHVAIRQKRGRVTLRWRMARAPGRTMTLIDRANGIATPLHAALHGSHGRIRFRPADPTVSHREIDAVILQNGLAEHELRVRGYRLR